MAYSSPPLILGAYAHLPVEMLEPFARSLRATGSQGRFHVVVAGYDAGALRQLGELADHVPVDGEYDRVPPRASAALRYARLRRGLRRFYPSLFTVAVRSASERASLDRWRNLEFRLEGLQSLRYGHYLRCLEEDAPDAEVVMISDLRDVVFQRDPFADPVTGRPRSISRTVPSRSDMTASTRHGCETSTEASSSRLGVVSRSRARESWSGREPR